MISIAPFRFDVTPPLGHALLGGLVPPAIAIDDELEAIGYVLLSDDLPIVVCVLDWAGLMNASHLKFRSALAEAAGTTVERVALHCMHQHNAPFVCEQTRQILAAHEEFPPLFDPTFFQACLDRGSRALRAALQTPRAVTHVAHAAATVERVASNRRVDRDGSGNVLKMRGSACTDSHLIDLPEGTIDPALQTIAYYSGDERMVACHYYATHPMSYYRDGRVTSDFCGLARKRHQAADPNCTHLYFTGCAGNIAAGKYNDGSPAARERLSQRIYQGIIDAESNLQPEPLRSVCWRETTLPPTSRPVPSIASLGETVGGPTARQVGTILQAYWTAWHRRTTPLPLQCLHLNDHAILHLPGEMFIEYQLHARALQPDYSVLVAAYGDGGPWYVPVAIEYHLGGYETQVAFCEPSIELTIKDAIKQLVS